MSHEEKSFPKSTLSRCSDEPNRVQLLRILIIADENNELYHFYITMQQRAVWPVSARIKSIERSHVKRHRYRRRKTIVGTASRET